MNWWARYSQTQEERRWEKRDLTPLEKTLLMDVTGDDDVGGYNPQDSEFVPLALSSIYHMEDGGDLDGQWVWYWNGDEVVASHGGTHGLHFPGRDMDQWYRGRYSPSLNMVTVTIPSRSYMQGKAIDEQTWLKTDENAQEVINGIHKRFKNVQRIVAIE